MFRTIATGFPSSIAGLNLYCFTAYSPLSQPKPHTSQPNPGTPLTAHACFCLANGLRAK
jgi:hypothetical protein